MYKWYNLSWSDNSLSEVFSRSIHVTANGSILFFFILHPYFKHLHTLTNMNSNPCLPTSQLSHAVVSDSLWPQGLQHARLPYPSLTSGVYSNSCLLSWWCHPTISSSVIPFSSHLQYFQHQGLFKWVSSSHQVAKVLEFQLQHQSFQWVFRSDFL